MDKVERLFKQFDARCTSPLEGKSAFNPNDFNVEFRTWANFFTMEAIVDIGLSNVLGFLDRGDDETMAETLSGTLYSASYRDSIHSLLTAQSHLVWEYGWYKTLWKWVPRVSARYRQLVRKGRGFEGIVMHQTRRRLKQYQAGESIDDFFEAMMETKEGVPHQLPFGEIFAELSVMSKSIFWPIKRSPILLTVLLIII